MCFHPKRTAPAESTFALSRHKLDPVILLGILLDDRAGSVLAIVVGHDQFIIDRNTIKLGAKPLQHNTDICLFIECRNYQTEFVVTHWAHWQHGTVVALGWASLLRCWLKSVNGSAPKNTAKPLCYCIVRQLRMCKTMRSPEPVGLKSSARSLPLLPPGRRAAGHPPG